MFRRAMLVWLALSLFPAIASSQNPGIKQGDPGFYFDFPGSTISVIRGESWCFNAYAMNYGWASVTCPGFVDTFAVVSSDFQGWPISNTFLAFEQGIEGEDAEGKCYIINDDGVAPWYFVTEVCITVPCDATVGELNTLTLQMAYCDETMTAQPDSGDCEDPNFQSELPRWSLITQDFEVMASPPSLYILQDTLYLVDYRQAQAYVPFSICNGDPCAPPTDFDYVITNSDTEYPYETNGTAEGVAGGACEDVHAIVNGTLHLVCTYDTLTIIAWDAATGTEYDTCVQAIHVVEPPCCVPIFNRSIIVMLVLLLVATAAVLLRKRAMSRKFMIILAIALLPAAVSAQNPGIKQGDPAFYFDFPGGTVSIIRGESWCFTAYACNYGWNSAACPEYYDTFAVVSSDLLGWPLTITFLAHYGQGTEGEDAEGKCYIINDDGTDPWYFVTEACFTVPCDATVGELNTLTLQMAYCDETMTAQPDSGDCEDPNIQTDIPRWSLITQDFEVVESPPSLFIMQDTLYYVGKYQTEAYVPFALCNGDPCSLPVDYVFRITNTENHGVPIDQVDSLYSVAGGECEDVYAIINGVVYDIGEYDTLTIVAWDMGTGTVYDTCVQAINIYESCIGCPLFDKTAVIVLVLMVTAAAAVMIRIRMMN